MTTQKVNLCWKTIPKLATSPGRPSKQRTSLRSPLIMQATSCGTSSNQGTSLETPQTWNLSGPGRPDLNWKPPLAIHSNRNLPWKATHTVNTPWKTTQTGTSPGRPSIQGTTPGRLPKTWEPHLKTTHTKKVMQRSQWFLLTASWMRKSSSVLTASTLPAVVFLVRYRAWRKQETFLSSVIN